MRNRIERIVCRLKGHDWEQRPVVRKWDSNEVVGVCGRCGEEATRAQAAATYAFGGGPPGWLLDQPPEAEIIAAYRDGDIDEEEMEFLLDKQYSENTP